MTAEQPAAEDAAAHLPATQAPAVPAIRVSHAERDQVVELLRDAAGDGRLTADELEERVEAALGARTQADLDALTADLPAPSQPAQKDLVKISQRFGDVERKGRWVVPRRMEIQATAGDVKLDFTEAVVTSPTLEIDVDLGFGAGLTLVTQPGIVVLTDDLSARMGDVTVRQPRDAQPDVPVILSIELTGRLRGGDILVRPPRRPAGQWIRRKPRD
jgi:Domain of unknown function (DUF1707)